MERKSMIKVRGGFSDRAGIDPCNIQMQIDDFDERTRTFISNKLYDFLQVTFNHECETRNIKYGPTDQNLSNIFCKNLMFMQFKKEILKLVIGKKSMRLSSGVEL